VREDGRSNPRQLWLREDNVTEFARLRQSGVKNSTLPTGGPPYYPPVSSKGPQLFQGYMSFQEWSRFAFGLQGQDRRVRRRPQPSLIFRLGIALAILLCAAKDVSALALPYAATQPPWQVTETTATLSGMATPNGLLTVAWFEWGTNLNYGRLTSPTNVSPELLT
jgi:hypothetical protein